MFGSVGHSLLRLSFVPHLSTFSRLASSFAGKSYSELSAVERRQYEKQKSTIQQQTKKSRKNDEFDNELIGSPTKPSSSSLNSTVSILDRITSTPTSRVVVSESVLQSIRQYESIRESQLSADRVSPEVSSDIKAAEPPARDVDDTNEHSSIRTSTHPQPGVRWKLNEHPQRGSVGLNRRQRKFLKTTKKRARKSDRLQGKQRAANWDQEEFRAMRDE